MLGYQDSLRCVGDGAVWEGPRTPRKEERREAGKNRLDVQLARKPHNDEEKGRKKNEPTDIEPGEQQDTREIPRRVRKEPVA